MISLYTEYISGQQAALSKLKVKVEQHAYFADFLESVASEAYIPLEVYLSKPLQHLIKLPHFMEQLLKCTDPEDEEEYADCCQVVDLVKEICQTVDGLLVGPSGSVGSSKETWAHQYECLSWLQTNLSFKDIEHLVDFNSETTFLGPRKLLYASFFTDMASQKIVALFLFNDFLIIGLPHGRLPKNKVLTVTNFFDIPEALGCKYDLLYEKPLLLKEVTLCGRSSIADTIIEFNITQPSKTKSNSSSNLKLRAATFEQYSTFLERLNSAQERYSRVQHLNSKLALGRAREFVGSPLTIVSLESIQAVQLYTRNCK